MKYSLEKQKLLFNDFKELKKEVVLSQGEVLYEMYENDLILPLSFFSDAETRTALGIAIAHANKKYYSEKDFEVFLNNLKKDPLDKSKRENKTGEDFIKENTILPSIAILDDPISIPTNINELISLNSRYNSVKTLSNQKYVDDILEEIEDSLDSIKIGNLNLNDINLKLFNNHLSILSNSISDYQLKVTKILCEFVYESYLATEKDINDFHKNIFKYLSVNFILKVNEIYPNEAINILERKISNGVGIDWDLLSNSEIKSLNLKKDSAVLYHYMAMSQRSGSLSDSLKFYNNTFIKDIYTLEEFKKRSIRAHKELKNFKQEELWGDEMLDTLYCISLVENGARTKSLNFIEILEYFQTQDYKKINLEEFNVFFNKLFDKSYSSGSEIFLDHSGITSISYLHSRILIPLINIYFSKIDEFNLYGDENSVKRTETLVKTIRKIKKDFNYVSSDENDSYMYEYAEIESKFYNYSLKFLDELQNNNITKKQADVIYDLLTTDHEISFILLSALIQKIRDANLLWTINESALFLRDNNDAKFMFQGKIQEFKKIGVSKETLVRPILDLMPELETTVGSMNAERRHSVVKYVVEKNLKEIAEKNIRKSYSKVNSSLFGNFLNKDILQFSKKSFYSIEYIEENLNKDTIRHNSRINGKVFDSWNNISVDNLEKLMNISLDIKRENEIINKFILKTIEKQPSKFISLKGHDFIYENSEDYEKIFGYNYKELLNHLIKSENKEVLFKKVPVQYLLSNLEYIVEKKDFLTVEHLFDAVKFDSFINSFNKLSYNYQKEILLSNTLGFKIISEDILEYSSDRLLLNVLNPEELKDSIKLLQNIRRNIKLHNITSDDNICSYDKFEYMWEFADVIKSIQIPLKEFGNEINEFFIEQFPISIYSGHINLNPRLSRFSTKQFLNLLNKIESIEGFNGVEIENGSRKNLYSLIFEDEIDKETDGYSIKDLECSVLDFLDTLNALKSKPFHYSSAIVELQKDISYTLMKVFDAYKEHNYDSVFIHELSSFMQISNKDKLQNYSFRENLIHTFFNAYIDRDIFFDGVRQASNRVLEDKLDFSRNARTLFFSSFPLLFSYENYDKEYAETNDYTNDEVLDIKNRFLENAPGIYFRKNLFFNENIEGKEFVELLSDNLKENHIWQVIMSYKLIRSNYGELSLNQQDYILQAITESPNISLSGLKVMLNIFNLIDETLYIQDADFLMDYEKDNLRYITSRFFNMIDVNEVDYKDIKINILNRILELEINENLNAIKKVKKF